MDSVITKGFMPQERQRVAALYWQAFAAKLIHVLGPPPKALEFIAAQLNPDFALVARGPVGDILGVAGFKTAKGGLIGGEMADLAEVYGWFSALWRGPLLALIERDLARDILLMDGICVASAARGTGIGTALLRAIKDEAVAQGLGSVRLDVIDSNPRARALYEREGFVATGQETLGLLRPVFGFSSSTRMLFTRPTGP
ncbi:GNAT family N-acetyltransferase [Sulfitobacter sp. F26204]|uniref:GNAT family N-acetyltransferase n=1 Tax=Sulfitobacter sp. F26204 TaxID=2996014 RepID=UPI00225E4308|nr:GNAT family N-acetyltransferase [Sulfitobacter sp. F26204]MCX7561053.1 GNAT family N-acetyltransferase [Sulfitobacter sp. F26204]